jgi:nucleoside-diphosphate-sugar epimerase
VDRLIVGCGYLGGRVAPRWRDGRLFVTTRSHARADEWRRQGLEPVVCDVLDTASLRGLPAVATVLYAVGLDRAAGRSMREVYVQGLANVLAALPAPGRFLYVSSTSVYGQTHGEDVDETAATEPAEEAGRVVLEAERLVRQRLPAAVVLRFAGIYGPGRLLRRAGIEAGEPIATDPDGWLNLIHVEDGAAAVGAAEDCAADGSVYNVCDDRPARRREFYTELARLLGAPSPRFEPAGQGGANRRVVNRRMREALGVVLRYPTFVGGLRAAVADS